jgi:hypothetical protein
MDGMKPASEDPAPDREAIPSQLTQLRHGDHAVLAARERRHGPAHRGWVICVALRATEIAHPARVAGTR